MANQGSGIPSFQGYEYQILTTVWVGLELVIRRRCCDYVIVEPASQEDIAAQLRIDNERASATVRSSSPDGYPIEVQIKLRRSGHWTKAPFAAVLNGETDEAGERGPARRLRPIEQLIETPTLRYTMVTDARVNDDLASFCVADIGELSTAAALPGDRLAALDRPEMARRIGVLTECTPELLVLRSREILRLVHVPVTKADACLTALQRAVRNRLLGELPNEWRREEIESILREHDGFPERRELPPLVRPNNYVNLQDQLATRHVLLVTGPPGSGKTHVSQHLAQEHRLQDNPYEVVEIQGSDGVGKVRARLGDEGLILFFIHDPWGMYEAGDRAQEWAAELPKLALRAGPGRKFLITSRTAIKEEHVPAELRNVLTAADRAVTEENYTQAERAEIVRIALRNATLAQADFVARHRQRILDQLRVPLAIESFAQSLMCSNMEPEPRLDDLIQASNVEAIGRTVQEEIEAKGEEAIAGAVVLWALLSPRPILSPDVARRGRQDVRQGGYQGRIDPEKLLTHFIRSKRLAPGPDATSFYTHPTFIEGLDRLVREHPGIADDVLSALLAGMCAAGRVDKTRAIVRHLKRRNTPIPLSAQDTLNRHLIEQLDRIGWFDAYQAFVDVAQYSDGHAPVTLLARMLTTGPVRRRGGFPLTWRPPELAPAETEAVRGSAEAASAARIFVRLGLLDDSEGRYEAEQLVSFFGQFGWDLTADFVEALRESFEHQSVCAPVLAHAALLGPQPPFDDVLAAGLEELDRVHQSLSEMGEQFRRADQAELDGEEASHVFEQPTELLYAPERVLKVAVRMRRAREGHGWLVGHPRIADLIEPWVDAISEGAAEEEVQAILAHCPADDRRLGWRAVGRARARGFAPQLLVALADAPEHELPDVIRAISDVIPRADWPVQVVPVVTGQSLCRRAWIAAATRHPYLQAIEPPVSDDLLPGLFQADEIAALEACRRWEGPQPIREMIATFKAPERAALRDLLESPDEEQAVKAGLVLYELGEDVTGSLSGWAHSGETNVRFFAYHLAGMLRSKQGLRILRRHGMVDPDYRCRRVAMGYLASNAAEVDWALVCRTAKDASGPVREYCARLIGRYEYQAGEPTLRALLKDSRDSSEDHHITIYGGPNRHVARAAAEALGRLPTLSPATVAEIVEFLRGGEGQCPDWVVHYHLVNCLAWTSNSDLLSLFVNLLADERYLPGPSRAGFPIRYAAAWGVANTLREHPELSDAIDLGRVLKSARHTDPRLAGPCLIALGFTDPHAREATYHVIRGSVDAPHRAALYALAATLGTDIVPEDCWVLVGAEHPSLETAKYLAPEAPPNNAEWCEWIRRRPAVRVWLESIQSSEGLHPALRYVLWLLAGQEDHDMVNPSDLQADDLAERSPLVTTRTLLGGE